jgi:alkylation response protein AidB-like acyl-CoA dehydrogenase
MVIASIPSLSAADARTRPADPFELLLDRQLGAWAARERSADEHGVCRLPAATLAELRDSRVLAAPIPPALGGAGASLAVTARAVRRVAQVAPATALCLAMPLGNAANTRIPDESVPLPLRRAAAEGRSWIAARALEGAVLAVANSEPGAGGDLEKTRTRAVRGDDGCVRLSGAKSFATLGPDADYFLCVARVEEGPLDAFFVARDAEGVSLLDDWDALGLRATASVGLTLEQAKASATFVYPGAISGANARHWSTVLLAAVFAGIGEGALAAAAECAPASSSWARATIADCTLALDAAVGFVDAVAYEDHVPGAAVYSERCRRAKSFAARTALEVAARCAMVSGGRAYRPDHMVARALCAAAAGPCLRPPLPQAMDQIAALAFEEAAARRAVRS